eukprot:COSAG03_NODE_420_length_8055_cov_3.206134_3_plen_282_part_00
MWRQSAALSHTREWCACLHQGWVFLHEGLTADYTAEPLHHARPLDSSEVYAFSGLAARFGGFIALGLNELWRGQAYISTVFCGPDPAEPVLGVYRKSYLWPNPPTGTAAGAGGDDWFVKFLENYVPHRQGFRLERGILGAGEGTTVLPVDGKKLGCMICADGNVEEAWRPFERGAAELIFWQNNRGGMSIGDGSRMDPCLRAHELQTPMILTNRVGFSHHYFQPGGCCAVADDGRVVVRANSDGEEEMVTGCFADLYRVRKAPIWATRRGETAVVPSRSKL